MLRRAMCRLMTAGPPVRVVQRIPADVHAGGPGTGLPHSVENGCSFRAAPVRMAVSVTALATLSCTCRSKMLGMM